MSSSKDRCFDCGLECDTAPVVISEKPPVKIYLCKECAEIRMSEPEEH